MFSKLLGLLRIVKLWKRKTQKRVPVGKILQCYNRANNIFLIFYPRYFFLALKVSLLEGRVNIVGWPQPSSIWELSLTKYTQMTSQIFNMQKSVECFFSSKWGVIKIPNRQGDIFLFCDQAQVPKILNPKAGKIYPIRYILDFLFKNQLQSLAWFFRLYVNNNKYEIWLRTHRE